MTEIQAAILIAGVWSIWFAIVLHMFVIGLQIKELKK